MYTPQRRKDDGLARKFLAVLRGALMTLGAFVIFSSLFFGLTIGRAIARHDDKPLPRNAVLTYTFKSKLGEDDAAPSLMQPLPSPSRSFGELIASLDAAARDARVHGFVARLQDLSLSPAQIQELRDTVAKLRAAHKFTAIYAEDLGGMSGGMGAYYLASAFEKIWLQPVGAVSINGVSAEVPFFKGALDKAGVSAEFRHKGIYKSMPESLTEPGMTPPHRAMMTALVQDLSGQITEGIAKARGFRPEEIRAIVDDSPYTGTMAQKLKLVDRIGYYEDVVDDAKRKAGPGAEAVSLADYEPPAPDKRIRKKIALIVGAGDIISHRAAHMGLSGADMPADKIAKAFEEAGKDKNVVAAVFRIDSPGGSPEAAETIRHAVQLFQKKGKPVIVSMGGYAASGGYWIATPADKIVAEPATFTGSIGVFGGKFVLAGLWQKLGLRFDSVTVGENAGMWSSNHGFTEKQKAKFDSMLADIYDNFISRVAEGRKLTPEAVRAIAEGRVWTGRQAKAVGLVDALGGVDQAVALAKTAAHLPPGQDAALKRFPARKNPFEMLVELMGDDDDAEASLFPALKLDISTVLESAQQEAEPLKMQDIIVH